MSDDELSALALAVREASDAAALALASTALAWKTFERDLANDAETVSAALQTHLALAETADPDGIVRLERSGLRLDAIGNDPKYVDRALEAARAARETLDRAAAADGPAERALRATVAAVTSAGLSDSSKAELDERFRALVRVADRIDRRRRAGVDVTQEVAALEQDAGEPEPVFRLALTAWREALARRSGAVAVAFRQLVDEAVTQVSDRDGTDPEFDELLLHAVAAVLQAIRRGPGGGRWAAVTAWHVRQRLARARTGDDGWARTGIT